MKPLIGTDLKRFLRDYKRQHRPRHTIAALLQSVEYPVNVGAIFRLADAADMERLVLTGITPQPPHPTIDKVGRYKSKKVEWHYQEDAVAAAEALQADGYHLLAVELAEGAVPYHHYDYPQRVCLVVGHEDHGVTKATLAACDGAVFLPMYGKGRSLNVNVALSIVVYHILHPGSSGAEEEP
ncbi:MAG: TrmH family RNA methyltransferase [Candidatus Promineifilaceae bacterium]|nr:TrmH family RNA methyltransferase [Candidatus Promineifilaceae bacterium]